MLFLSRFLQRFHKTEKHKTDNGDGVPCIGEKGKPYRCKILLLDDTEYMLDVRSSSKGLVLLERVFSHLNLIEKDYFGLRFLDHTSQTQWLDPSKSISAQLKSPPPHPLYFGVKFYAADPCKLHEEITRYQFFLQVKRDILQGRLPVTFDLASELAALSVQSELGDYDPKRYSYGYVSEFRFVPNQTEEFENRVMQMHRALVGQVPATAEWRYLERVKWLDMYGVDLHPVLGDGGVEYFLCLTPSGVVIYRNKHKMASYFWPRITKITFKNKMFILRVKDKNNDENTYAFECTNKNACKHLWKCCVEHHAFFRLTSANESYSSNGKLLSLGSKYRYSGRTEKQVLADAMNRPAPQVIRTPSRRHQRRNSTGAETVQGLMAAPTQSESYLAAPEQPIKTRSHTVHKRELGYQSAPDSPRSSRSAPWERKGGLFTCPDSPTSVVSAKLFPGRRAAPSESEAESVASTHHRHRHRHRHRDAESENETSHRHRRSHHSRRSRSDYWCPAETDGSESEASHRHRQRRSRRSAENLTTTEAQWQGVQARLRDGGGGAGPQATATGGFPMRPNGSLSSMVSEQSAASKRARRRRSRSPSNKQPPAELAQHFKYIDPEAEGLDNQQLRQLDLQFTSVETSSQVPKAHKHRARSRDRRSAVDEQQPQQQQQQQPQQQQPAAAAAAVTNLPVAVPAGEPPPPYTDSPARPPPPQYHHHHRSANSLHNNTQQPQQQQHHHQQQQQQPQQQHSFSYRGFEEKMHSPASVQMNTTYTAPIVKTKPVNMITPPKVQYNVPIPTTQVIYGNYGNSAVVTATKQTAFQPIQSNQRLGNHARDDSGLGIESPQDSSSPTGYNGTNTPVIQPPQSSSMSSSNGYLVDGGYSLVCHSHTNHQPQPQSSANHISSAASSFSAPASAFNLHHMGHANTSGSQQTTPTYSKPAYSEQVSSRRTGSGHNSSATGVGLTVTNLSPQTNNPPQMFYRGSNKTTQL